MDDTLSEEHRLLRATVRQIVRDRVAPRAAEIDRERRYPEDVFVLFREQGLLGLLFGEEEGGFGAGTLGLAIAIEEVARACATSAQVLTLTALTAWPLRLAGPPSLRAAYVPAVAAGRLR
ncbi:MAG: acyl-CoA dehydrogenase family protein, partial [Chloroflexi bacterium]|nr:acyl-CoA dehydrogenase family protein [Chloroflexota bacterium]